MNATRRRKKDDEEEEDIFAKLLESPEPHKDHRTMQLTSEERQWALDLKRTVEQDHAELHNLSDMEYAVYAIISQGNQADALTRMGAIQMFREEYQVDNSIEQGVYMLGELMKQQEGLLLCLDVDSATLEGLHVMDIGALNPQAALAPCFISGVDYNWRIMVCGFYYYNLACQPCLGTVRAGNHTMADFVGWGWHHMNMEIQYRFSGEMFAHYPIKFTKMCCYNTNQAANIVWSLVKNVYPSSLMNVLQLGCQIPSESYEEAPKSLSERYLQPDLNQACLRMLTRANSLLTLRCRNDELFRL
ncbi:expressed unknown protein [Seminavis robusta]|uniref:Uncharacterized protein n=1 Tax=Seminavis robusta TaxID=568900 RepID=A0A9N8F554_9STRA|nr:expressed unknown protein [Seminavis robusta]|eukprot:Sro3143_g344390.1 n/a (302) ;mRNA; f:940-1934